MKNKTGSQLRPKLYIWIWLLGLSLVPALPAQAQTVATLQEGYELLNRGWVDRAIPYLEDAVRQNPQSIEARLALANANLKIGSFLSIEKAFQGFKDVLNLDPQNKEALTALGNLGEYRFDWRDDGITALNTLISQEPNNMVARAQRALLNGYLGNLKDAIEDYDVVIPTNPPPKVVIAAAQSYTYAGEYSKALGLFNQYQQSGGTIEDYAAIAYGIVLRETGDPAASVQVLEKELATATKLDGIAIRTRAALSVSYSQVDQMEKAIAVLEPLKPRFDSRMILARTYHQIGQGDDRVELEQDVIDIYYQVLDAPLPPNYESARPGDDVNFYITNAIAREIADVLSGIPRERELSRRLYVELVKVLPDDRILPVNLAIVERQLGLISRATLRQRIQPYVALPAIDYDRRLLAQALVRLDSPDPSLLPFYQPFVDAKVDEPLLWFRIAQMQIQDNNLAAAKTSLANYQATKDGQRNPYAALLLLAEIDRRESNITASLQKYQEIIAAERVDRGTRSGALQALAGIYRVQGKLPEAIALYDQIIARYPDDQSKRLGRTSLAYQAGQISETEAVNILNQWLTTRPATDTPLELYSLVAALPAGPEKEALYQRLLAATPESVPIQLRLLQVVAMRDPDAARAQLAELIAKDPDNLGSYFIQGELAQDIDDLDLASEAYEAILAKSAQNTDALAALGGVRFQQRQYDEARDLYAEVLQLEPGNRIAQTALAELTAARGDRLRAIDQLEEIQQSGEQTNEQSNDAPTPDPRLEWRRQQIETDFLQQRGFQPPWERY
jgi:cellulose synthase operon protein C